MAKNIFKTLSKSRILLIILSIVAVVLIGIVIFFITRDNSSIPAGIKSKLTFSPLVIPSDVNNYSTSDYKIAAAEDKVQTLTYIIHLTNGDISISEQSQPPEFAEIPEYKDRFLNNVAKQYSTVQTSNGIIYLGRLTRQDNKQLGIMLERGLLIFMNPDKGMELDETQWRSLGDNLEIQKINN